MRKYADVRIDLTVLFDDDGIADLFEQAQEAAEDALGGSLHNPAFRGAEVIGAVRNTLEIPQ